MTMQSPSQQRQTVMLPANKKRLGLMQMQVDSPQRVTIRRADGKAQSIYVKVRDARRYQDTKLRVLYVCLAKECRDAKGINRTWPSEKALLADHPDNETMVREEQAHVYGMWSDAADPKWGKDCPECTATEPCAQHAGTAPIVGLLSFESAPAATPAAAEVTEDLARAIAENPELVKAIAAQLAKVAEAPPQDARPKK